MVRLELGDCLDVMRAMEPESVDAIVCDPPYGIGFMGREWDAAVPGVEWAAECLRVVKPGGHLVAFASTRTLHRLACAVEDAGFDIRETVHWCYYSGFPKSLDVSKAIDKAAGAEREVVGVKRHARDGDVSGQAWATRPMGEPFAMAATLGNGMGLITAPATDAARQWSGWGTALKPAVEPAVLARKPFSSTVAANVLRHGTGALNIDGCRIAPGDVAWPGPGDDTSKQWARSWSDSDAPMAQRWAAGGRSGPQGDPSLGRWPANLYHCPKPSTAEREMGTEGLPKRGAGELVDRTEGSAGMDNPRAGAGRTSEGRANFHPTVKPVALMRWLCRLVTPPGGVVLDPFMGSGTCGMAAVAEGFGYIGIELEPEYMAIANARIRYAATGLDVVSPLPAVKRQQAGLFG